MRRTALLFALAGLVGALVATPIAVYASHQFTDVDDSHIFHGAIDWLAANGITKGCNPPANTQYCPDDNVTRAQMAGFMKRLSEGQVVDAGLLAGYRATDLASRAAFISYQDAPDGQPYTLSTTITAPGPGILLLSGGVAAVVPSEGPKTQVFCYLEIDDETVVGTLRRVTVQPTPLVEDYRHCSTSGAAVIDAGTYTIDLEVPNNPFLGPNSLWALWVPFDGTGAIPTP